MGTSLYASGYRPAFLPKHYEATGITIAGEGQAGDRLRALGAPADWGDPVDAVAFFNDESGQLMALVGDYANGRRVEYRATRKGGRTSFTTPERSS